MMPKEGLAEAMAYHQRLMSGEGWRGRDWLLKRGLRDATIEEAMLGYDGEAITIPYLNPPLDDKVSVRMVRRRHLTGNIKYTTPKHGGTHLYGIVYTSSPKVCICEGEFDSLILRQMGYPAVAIPGVNAFKPEWRYLFAWTEELTVIMDGDEAGRSAAGKLASILGPVVGTMRVARLPEGKDINDLYLSDREQLQEIVGEKQRGYGG